MANVEPEPITAPERKRPKPKLTVLERKHPLAIRWFHWINFPVLAVMIWSGLLIYWSDSVQGSDLSGNVYGITLLGHKIELFPAADQTDMIAHRQVSTFPFENWYSPIRGYKPLDPALVEADKGTDQSPNEPIYWWDISARLAEGMAWHFTFMYLFAVNGLAYVIYLWRSKEWRQIVPDRQAFRQAIDVVLKDLFLSRKALPRQKFNGAQKFAYTGVIVMGFGSLVTGLAIFRPLEIPWLTALLGGYEKARLWHFLLMLAFCAFFFVHVTQVVRAGWNNFRAMVTGYEMAPAEEPSEV